MALGRRVGNSSYFFSGKITFLPKHSFLAMPANSYSTFESHWTGCDNTCCFSATHMRKIASRRFNWPDNTLAVILSVFLSYVSFGTAPVHALDPNLRLTQYMHKSWGTQDGSVPAAMSSITQTADGFLWFSALSQGIYRFDGVRFVSRTLPTHDKAMSTIVEVYGDHAGGLWALGEAQTGGAARTQTQSAGHLCRRGRGHKDCNDCEGQQRSCFNRVTRGCC